MIKEIVELPPGSKFGEKRKEKVYYWKKDEDKK